jgi:hypothetical protein
MKASIQLLVLLVLVSCLFAGEPPQGRGSQEELSPEAFRAPREGLAPFWLFNADMQPEEMERQLRAMKSAGIHSIVLHPRSGLGGKFGESEFPYYLSEQYFEMVKFTLETCRRLGMHVILYDEYNWPSGYAGGRVLRGGLVGTRRIEPNPEYIAKHLAMVEVPVGAGSGPQGSWEVPEGKLVAIIAARAEQGKLIRSTFKNLTSEVSENRLKWQVPEGDWRLLFFMQRDTLPRPGPGTTNEKNPPCCVDLMNAAAVDKFISVTHDEYYRRFAEYFGNTITAIFTDEPGFHNNRLDGYLANTVPWTEALPEFFKQRKGYSLLDSLPLLWVGEGEENAQVQMDFWDTLSTLYMNTYFRRIYEWCQAHGIESIGHVLEDTLRFHRTFEGGDFFKTVKYFHRPGIDQIGDRRFGMMNPKLGSSAARLFGVPHSWSETFADYGWGLTLEHMKAVINWHATSGLDLEVLSAFYYSLEGRRRQDSPPDLFYHQLWRHDFHSFADYASRMLYLAGRGKQVADIAIFYPTAAIMTAGGIMGFAPLGQLEEYFQAASMAVRASQHDFNYVDELALAGFSDLNVPVTLSRNEINVNGYTYSVIVLPAVPAISSGAAEMLEKFYRGGGKIIALGILPARAADGKTELVHGFLRRVFGTVEARPVERIAQSNESNGRAIFVPIPNMVSGEELAKSPIFWRSPTSFAQGRDLDYSQPWVQQFIKAIGQCAQEDLRLPAFTPSLAYLHKKVGDKDIYLLANDGTEVLREVVTFPRLGNPSWWDPYTGDVSEVKVFEQESGRTQIPLEIPPFGGLAIVFDGPNVALSQSHLTRSGARVEKVRREGTRLRASLLTEDQGSVAVAAAYRGRTLARTLRQPDRLEPLTIEGRWDFRLEPSDQRLPPRNLGSWTEDFPSFSGTGWYKKEISVAASWLASPRRVFLDLGTVREIAHVRLNGQSGGALLWRPYRLDITHLLKPGKNLLEIGVTNTLANAYAPPGPQRESFRPPASGLIGPVRLIPAKVLETEFAWE